MSSGAVPARFETPLRVRFDEAGGDGLVRTSSYLRWVQDVAWQHSEGAGFGRDWYGERSLTWLIRATELDVVGRLEYGVTVSVSTEVVGFRRVWARRLSEVHRQDGGLVARVTNDWVLLGPSGMPTRVPAPIVEAFAVALPTFQPIRVSVPTSARDTLVREFAVARRDLDPMAHMNNAAYVDYLEEAVEDAGGSDLIRAVPRRYRLEYALPAPPGLRLLATTSRTNEGWAYRLASTEGSELFRAVISAGGAKSG